MRYKNLYKNGYCALMMAAASLQTFAQKTSYKFDFGTGKKVAGYFAVTPRSEYNETTGYGFDSGSNLKAVSANKQSLTGDYITANAPFSFSVKLPEGNYDIEILLGDRKGSSATTIRTECRRLMLENVRTNYGKITRQTFTVHVKDSLIRNANGSVIKKVKLKPRELKYLHWDNRLTIEFNDSLPKICALKIKPNKTACTIFLAGNSTVVDQDREPWAAWGQMFPAFLVPGKVAVANYAESGETLLAFERENRLNKIWSMAKPGDYLFIEFAHNDQKPGGNHLDAFTSYKSVLKKWIDEAKKRKVIPVLITSMHRRNFDSAGKIINTLLDYPEAMRQTAKEEKVLLIDLNAMSKILYESWGPERSLKAFVHYPANSFPGQQVALSDNTHFSTYGAYILAQCFVNSIIKQKLPLAAFLKNDLVEFEVKNPSPFENFYWPPASYQQVSKPDGN
ncbi:MAG: rhamnogalacturonan acetylesterase [Bacteroidota bacterium]